MPHDFHPHPKSNKHIEPWVALPVCHLGDLDLWFFSYTHIQNGVGFHSGNMSYKKQGIWGFVAGGRAGYHNVYIVAVCLK